MGKLAPAIACCLLFAVPAAGCAQHPGDSSGVTDSVSEQQLHEQVDRQVAAAAADMYGWNPADTVAEPLAGNVRVPFSKEGTIDPMDILRKKRISSD